MQNFGKQFSQELRLSENREPVKNLLLEGPELISLEEEKQEGETSFSFSSDTRRYYLGHKDKKSFFLIEYFDILPNNLSKEEKEKFTKEIRSQGKVNKLVYTLRHGEVPVSEEEMGGLNQSKEYCIAQPRDFEKDLISNFVLNDTNKQIISEILIRYSELRTEEIQQIIKQATDAFHKQGHEAIRTIFSCFPKKAIKEIKAKIREQILPNPQKIEIGELVEILKDGKALFYTGAGISMAEGVYDMDQLEEVLGIEMSEKTDSFLKKAVTNPQEVIDSWEEFTKVAFEKPATSAHQSLGKLAQKLKSQIFTENIDHLQEKAGVKSIHLTGSWLKENVQPEWLRDIDTIVTIGLSYDDRGFLSWYKENNFNGKIIAINLNQQPPYLGGEDYMLKGDCQEIIPELEKSL